MLETARTREGITSSLLGVVTNFALFAVKLVAGIAIGSLALIADAVETLGDVLTSFVALLGFKIGARKPDALHPYGHERAEEIAALTIAILLAVAGVQFAIESVKRLLAPTAGEFEAWIVAVVVVSVLVKLLLALQALRTGRRIESGVLRANAWNYFTDAFASLLVLVALAGRYYGVFWIDPVAAFVISLLIVRVGLRLYFQSSDALLGRGVDEATRQEIERLVCAQKDVLACQEVEVHWYGRKRHVSLRVQVPDDLTVKESHEVAERIQRALLGVHADWEPLVNVVPGERRHPRGGHTPEALTE